jgi:hypothetical protein
MVVRAVVLLLVIVFAGMQGAQAAKKGTEGDAGASAPRVMPSTAFAIKPWQVVFTRLAGPHRR